MRLLRTAYGRAAGLALHWLGAAGDSAPTMDVSLGLQWMEDVYDRGADVTAWIPGLRVNLVF